MLGLWISLGVLGFLLLGFIALLIGTFISHDHNFGHRFSSDSNITGNSYSKEEFGLDYKLVEVPMDGVLLKGYIYSYKGYDPKKIIVYAHGMWSSTLAYIQDIEYFCKKGFQVFALDHEGTDMSEGKSLRGLCNSLRCIDYELSYIEKNYPDLDIYVAGHSWGGFATVNAPLYHPNIKGICAFAPFIDIASQLKGMFSKKIWFIIPYFLIVEHILLGKYSHASAYKSLKNYKGNIVILASLNDPMVKYKYNTGKMKKMGINAHYIINEDRFHTPHYSKEAVNALMVYYKETAALTKEERVEYQKKVDFRSLGQLDSAIMDEAIEYLMK